MRTLATTASGNDLAKLVLIASTMCAARADERFGTVISAKTRAFKDQQKTADPAQSSNNWIVARGKVHWARTKFTMNKSMVARQRIRIAQ